MKDHEVEADKILRKYIFTFIGAGRNMYEVLFFCFYKTAFFHHFFWIDLLVLKLREVLLGLDLFDQ